MKTVSVLLLAFVCVGLVSCTRPSDQPGSPVALKYTEFPDVMDQEDMPRSEEPRHVSLIAILADPSRFHGTFVRVQGVINLELEGDQVCLDRGSLQYYVTKNCLALSLAPGEIANSYKEIAQWNGHYAVLEGEVSASDPGRFSHYSGSLVDVSRIVFITPGRQLQPID